jgi:hypothetical protein
VLTVKFGGQVIIGGSLSLTVTVKLQVASGATLLEAVQLTVVLPLGNTLPDGGVQVTVGDGRPVVITLKLTEAEQRPGVVFATTGLDGQVIVGGIPICIVKSA